MTSFSNILFFSMGEDQAHEQNNKCIKTDGGAIGLFVMLTLSQNGQ